MNINNMSPAALAEELGARLKQARLNADYTQTDLATRAGLSRKVVLNAERGKAQLENVVAILVALNLTEQLNLFIPKQEISPLQLAKMKGKERQRASRSKTKSDNNTDDAADW